MGLSQKIADSAPFLLLVSPPTKRDMGCEPPVILMLDSLSTNFKSTPTTEQGGSPFLRPKRPRRPPKTSAQSASARLRRPQAPTSAAQVTAEAARRRVCSWPSRANACCHRPRRDHGGPLETETGTEPLDETVIREKKQGGKESPEGLGSVLGTQYCKKKKKN